VVEPSSSSLELETLLETTLALVLTTFLKLTSLALLILEELGVAATEGTLGAKVITSLPKQQERAEVRIVVPKD
jgi:hypothetical protein